MDKKRKRDQNVLLRFSMDEMKLLHKKMEEAGIHNREAYLRKMALDGYIIKEDYSMLKGVFHELSRIGNNLNQVAKVANTYGDVNQSELKAIKKDLDKIWQLLLSLA